MGEEFQFRARLAQDSPSHSVTAGEFVRQFVRSRQQADRAPLFVTHHGRRTHVLLRHDYYEDLCRQATASGDSDDSADALLKRFGEWLDHGFIAVDAELRIESINANASAICRVEAATAEGRPIDQAIPAIADTILLAHLRRTQRSSEPTLAEVPSPFTPNSWIRFRTFPWQGRLVLMFHDITEEVRSQRLADQEAAIMEAIALRGDLGHARLTVRGTIERADDVLCAFLGLSEDRLAGAPLVDLVDIQHRVAFRQALESVFRGEGPRKLRTRMIANHQPVRDAEAAIVQLRGTYGVEGAIVVLGPAAGEQPADSA